MALITSAASGNFNAGATWTGGVVPTVGDEARAATGHTITITANATCDEVSNAGTGIFTLNDGVTLTANVTSKSTTTSRNCLQFTAASPAVGTIVGNCTGGTVSGAVAVAFTSTGTLTITGNLLGGSATNAHACAVSSTGTLNLTGNATGGSGTAYGINGTGNANIFMTGNALGGSGNTALGVIVAHTTATVTVTGNATGGTGSNSTAFYNQSTGLATILGIATGANLGSFSGGNTGGGVHNQTTGTIILKRAVGNAFGPGNTAGLNAAPGAYNNTSGIIEIEELEFGQYGMSPTSGSGIRLKKVSTNAAIFTYVDAGAAKTLVDATTGQMPAATDVRTGVSYASGALTGTCAVPAAASVGFGVPVDATTGTAALTPASVWDHLLSAITTSDTIGLLLKTNIDATISSRSTATTAGIADAVWDEATSGHTTAETYGGRVVRSTTANNELQINAQNHASANVHQFQAEVITSSAFDASVITAFAVPELQEIHAIHGLKSGSALTVTPSSRVAGAISQSITGDGTTTTTVTRT